MKSALYVYTISSRHETRARILDAAIAVLEESPREVNMRRVAQLAGVSRQAVYLHFANRAALLVAAARHVDDRFDLQRSLEPVVAATTAEQLLARYAEFLASYNPRLYGVVRAADAARRSDPAIGAAWADRLRNRRAGGSRVAIRLAAWGRLAPAWTSRTAGEWLTAQGSVKVWEELVLDLGWSRRRFTETMTRAFTRALLVSRRPTVAPNIKTS